MNIHNEIDMKKIFCIAIVIALTFVLCGCGNMSMGFGTYTFNKIHIDGYNYSGCLTVEKWYDGNNGIEVDTVEAGHLFLSEGCNYILVHTKCPFCDDTDE